MREEIALDSEKLHLYRASRQIDAVLSIGVLTLGSDMTLTNMV